MASPRSLYRDLTIPEPGSTTARDGELRLTRLPPQILSLGERAGIVLPPSMKAMTFRCGSAIVERDGERIELDPKAIAAGGSPADAPMVTRPYHPIVHDIVLATTDYNPRASFGAEPGEPGNPVDLGGHAPDEWASPVRPDPRPLRGVLLAVHAFLPVARLYEKMTEARHPLSLGHYLPERFAQIRGLNRAGASTVFAHASPTPVGRALIDEMRRWIAHFGE